MHLPTSNQSLLGTALIPGRAANHSADYNDFVIQRTKLKFGQRALSIVGPCIWNRLPTELKTTINTVIFKRKLKTYIFCSPLAITLFYIILRSSLLLPVLTIEVASDRMVSTSTS